MISSRSSLLFSLLLGLSACSDKKADATPAAAPAVVHQPLVGVDLSSLHDSDVKGFWNLVEKNASACGKAHSLETSIRTDPKCKRSIFAARYIARLLKEIGRAHV